MTFAYHRHVSPLNRVSPEDAVGERLGSNNYVLWHGTIWTLPGASDLHPNVRTDGERHQIGGRGKNDDGVVAMTGRGDTEEECY